MPQSAITDQEPLRQNANIASIELLRGLASAVVCLYHFTNGNNNFISEANWIKAITGKGWLGVEIFFVISGFIIPYSMARSRYRWRDFPLFMLKRWARIDPPFWLSILFVLGLNALATLWLIPPFSVSWTRIFLHFGYLIPFFPHYEWLNGVYWTLGVEFQYYILVGLLYPVLFHKRSLYFWLTAGAFLTLTVFIYQPAFFFDYSMFFFLGFALFRRFDGQLKTWEFYLLSAFIFSFVYYNFNLQYVLAGFFPWLLIAFWPNLKVPGLRWLGMISYSLYLIHLPLGKKLIPLAARYMDGDGPRLVFVFFLFCFTLLLAYGFYQLIERPAMRWSKLVHYGERKAKSE
ncbi:MAG: acyltransferase [Haliscomenobacter sp.]|uniref:acyltransferase family protein n=1 Tax=Haliscomenobacter sp. TaxID=2717303 RepID=UPI0029A1DF42|nr:acyltransferase [Haliscomenobacter sp.]MDX2068010.1 acyltransferase [Haliscomenobacter sp.]